MVIGEPVVFRGQVDIVLLCRFEDLVFVGNALVTNRVDRVLPDKPRHHKDTRVLELFLTGGTEFRIVYRKGFQVDNFIQFHAYLPRFNCYCVFGTGTQRTNKTVFYCL